MHSQPVKFIKYHGLGNDYLILDSAQVGMRPDTELVRWICHRNYGVGSDGVLVEALPEKGAETGLRIFNPDGSEAEKSGNGIRIFSLWLSERGKPEWVISTPGGLVRSQVHADRRNVTVQMGRVSFWSGDIPLTGEPRLALDERVRLGGEEYRAVGATLGNPHLVVLCQSVSEEFARRYGPLLEHEPRCPNRTNVQFMQVLDRENIRIEIWERGAGYTLASGSSSCAAAAAAHRLGLCGSDVTVQVAGGRLYVQVGEQDEITLTGEVIKVMEGTAFPPET